MDDQSLKEMTSLSELIKLNGITKHTTHRHSITEEGNNLFLGHGIPHLLGDHSQVFLPAPGYYFLHGCARML